MSTSHLKACMWGLARLGYLAWIEGVSYVLARKSQRHEAVPVARGEAALYGLPGLGGAGQPTAALHGAR
jgi:hypothetical protein